MDNEDLTALLKFPPDAKIRMEFFAPEDKGHPARANLHMMIWLIETLTKEGDVILDPNSGAGTLMYATKMGRNVLNIELEPKMAAVQRANWEYFRLNQKPNGDFILLEGDCRRYLPIGEVVWESGYRQRVDHVIFSPPYAHLLGKPGPKLAALAKASGIEHDFDYGKNVAQIGHYSYFNYLIAMKAVYLGLLHSIKPGGYMCTITKDFVDSKKGGAYGHDGLIPLSADTIKLCMEVGFEMCQVRQRYAQPSMQLATTWRQNPGIPHVTTEEIIIMRRP